MTSILGIVGHPLGHSLSVPMHMSAIFHLGIDYVYMGFDIMPGTLAHAVDHLKGEHIKGFNVTIPYKEAIVPYLDSVDEHARRIGAVNTVNSEGGRLRGYNTDGTGYLRSLKEQSGFAPSGKQVLLIGAGGAARSVAFSLLEAGTERLIIANRTMEKAVKLAENLASYFPKAGLRPLPVDRISTLPYRDISLIINATSVGMKGAQHAGIDGLLALLGGSMALFNKDTVISDIVYNPVVTPLLKTAQLAGLKIHDGTGMLVYQGAESFRIWTGIEPPVDVMRQAVLRALKEKH